MMKKIIASLTLLSVLALLVVPVFTAATVTSVTPSHLTLTVDGTEDITLTPPTPKATVASADTLVATVTINATGDTVTVTGKAEGSTIVTIDNIQVTVIVARRIDPLGILTTFIQLARSILVLVAVLIIVYGAFLFATAAGDDKKVETGRKAIMFAIAAVIIAAVAHGLVVWIEGFV